MLKLRNDEPLAVELTARVKAGDVKQLRALLASNPGIAPYVVGDAKGAGRTPLHWAASNDDVALVDRHGGGAIPAKISTHVIVAGD